MFDPNKYDDTDSQAGNGKKLFSEKIIEEIKNLQKAMPLIMKECELLEDYVDKNPNVSTADHFREKLSGWSRIINGLAIVKNKYNVK